MRVPASPHAKLARGNAGARLEMPGEMRLVRKTAHRRHLGRHLAGAQKPTRPADAHVGQIGVRGDVELFPESTDKVCAAETGNGSQFLKADIGLVIVGKVVAGGAGEGRTMAANRAALDRWAIVPRVLRDTSGRSLEELEESFMAGNFR